MHYVNELLDYSKVPEDNHVILFTGNRVTNRGVLVMGGGNALACARALPSAPRDFAVALINSGQRSDHYCLAVPHRLNPKACLAVMFTKNHYANASDLYEVIAAIDELSQRAKYLSHMTFHLPYPAIGLGGLTREQLDKHVEALPDNVYVYVV